MKKSCIFLLLLLCIPNIHSSSKNSGQELYTAVGSSIIVCILTYIICTRISQNKIQQLESEKSSLQEEIEQLKSANQELLDNIFHNITDRLLTMPSLQNNSPSAYMQLFNDATKKVRLHQDLEILNQYPT